MTLIQLVVTLAVVGILLWLFNTYVTMIDARVKQIINILVIVVIVIWLLNVFGLLGGIDVPLPRFGGGRVN